MQLPVGDGFDSGMSMGSAIGVESGRGYTFTAVVRASGTSGSGLVLSVALEPSIFTANLSVPDTGVGGTWSTVSFSFVASSTVSRADILSLIVRGTQGKMEFNATSLLPQNNFLGMRLDVVDSLADLKFQGPLRYPGGCYAPFYRWKDGLLPLLARPTSFTPPNYCLAVAGGVNAYSDGFMQNGPGIDEYMALVSRIGATPAITVPLQFGSEKEITDARDWVEYCNGDSSDPKNVWAALRAARGHPEPYNVKMWYLGNEIAWQLRFPDYPASLNQSGGMTGVEYQRALESLIPALLAVDPSLVLLVVSSDERFNAPWLNSDVTPNISAASAHIAYENSDAGGSPSSASAATAQAKLPHTSVLPLLQSTRQMLDAGSGKGAHVRISVDEWGLGPPWVVKEFNTAHALYGASFLTMAVSNAKDQGLAYTNYFEPINEGALTVLQFSVAPTPLGLVLPYFGQLVGGMRLGLEGGSGVDDDVVACAAAFTSTLVSVITNRNSTSGYVQWLHFDGVNISSTATVHLLSATGGWSTGSFFSSSSFSLAVSAQGWVALPLPPFSVASVEVSKV